MPLPSVIRRRRWTILLLLPLLVLAACDTGSAPPALQPTEVLSKAAPAMAALKSFHFSLSTSKVDNAPSTLYITGADGDVARPGKLQATAKALTPFGAVEVKVAADGDQQYMTDPISQRWQKIPTSFNALALLDPGKAIADILANVKTPADAGSETIDGAACYRITATVAPDAVRALSPEITATDPLSTTLWIGSQDFLVRQVLITGALLKGEPATVVRTLKFSQFDTPVDIQMPAGVTP